MEDVGDSRGIGKYKCPCRIGKTDQIIGPYGRQQTNNNERRLIHLCKNNNLQIINGFYKHKDIHKYIWIQPTRNLKSIRLYDCKKQRKFKVQDVRAFKSVTCGSGHFLVKSQNIVPDCI